MQLFLSIEIIQNKPTNVRTYKIYWVLKLYIHLFVPFFHIFESTINL